MYAPSRIIFAAAVALHIDGLLSQGSLNIQPPNYDVSLNPLISSGHKVVLLNDVVKSLFHGYWQIIKHEVLKISYTTSTKKTTESIADSAVFMICGHPFANDPFVDFCVANLTWALRTTEKFKLSAVSQGTTTITLKVTGIDSNGKVKHDEYKLTLRIPARCSTEATIYRQLYQSCRPILDWLKPAVYNNTFIYTFPSRYPSNTRKLATLKFIGLNHRGILYLRIYCDNRSLLQNNNNMMLHVKTSRETVQLNSVCDANTKSFKLEISGEWKRVLSARSVIYLEYYAMETLCKNNGCLQSYHYLAHFLSKIRSKGDYACLNDTAGLIKSYADCFIPYTVTVSSSTSVHTLGGSLSLKCTPSTIYLPYKIYWRRVRDGVMSKKLLGSSTYYNRSRLTYNDNAVYRCYVLSISPYGGRFSVVAELEINLSDVFMGELRFRLPDKRFVKAYKRKASPIYKNETKEITKEIVGALHHGDTVNSSDVQFHVKQLSDCEGRLCLRGILSVHKNTIKLQNWTELEWMDNMIGEIQTKFNAYKVDNVLLNARGSCRSISEKNNENYVFNWPATYQGHTAEQICLGECFHVAHKTCKRRKGWNYAHWLKTNTTDCHRKCETGKELVKISKTNLTTSNIVALSSKLAAISSKDDFVSSSKVMFAVDAFENFAEFQKKSISSSESKEKRVVLNVMTSIDKVIAADRKVLKESEFQHNTSTRILKVIGDLGEVISSPVAYSINKKSFAIGGIAMDVDNFKGITIVAKHNESLQNSIEMYPKCHQFRNNELAAKIVIPETIKEFMKSEKQIKIVAATYNNPKLFKERLDFNDRTFIIKTSIISAEVRGYQIEGLKDPVLITFKVTNASLFPVEKKCVYWDFDNNNWSAEGCDLHFVDEINETITCACNHLTNFAVLFATTPPEGVHGFILSYITYVGIAISFVGEVLTFLTYLIFPMLRKKMPPKILMNLCVALIMTDILFIIGHKTFLSVDGCKTVSIFLQYFFLTVFSWSAVEGFQSFRSIVFPMRGEISNFMQKALLFGWGAPIILTAIGGAISLDDYVGDHWCVVKGMPFFATILAPISGVIFFNLICLIGIVRTLTTSAKNYNSNSMKMRSRFRITFGFSILFGITWIFGFFVVTNGIIVFQYIFCVLCSFKGLYIFLFYCIRSPTNRSVWCAFLRGLSVKEIERSGLRNKQLNRCNTYDTSTLTSSKGSSLPMFSSSEKSSSFPRLFKFASLSSSSKSMDNSRIDSLSSSKKLIDDGRSSSNT